MNYDAVLDCELTAGGMQTAPLRAEVTDVLARHIGMRTRFVLALICLLLPIQKAAAGWYHVENYEGFLGPFAIHLSLQTYDNFGSGITVEGSYFYDGKQSPIALYGKASGSRLALCEIPDNNEFNRIIIVGTKTPIGITGCSFSIDLNESGATGTWSQHAIKYPVTLKKVASLDDTGGGKIDGAVAIPFWAQTATNMFSGIYTSTGSGICMEKMQIINKGSKKVDQEIDFDKNDCNAGMLMTPIYLNVQKFSKKGSDVISVNFRNGGAGYATDYIFDSKTKTFRQKNLKK